MTGYHISMGYCAEFGAGDADYEERWKILQGVARQICDNPQEILEEARRLGAPEECECGCHLSDYIDNYAFPFTYDGHPIKVLQEQRELMQLAGSACAGKFHVRRAFVRLLMAKMHRLKLELNLHVV